MLHLLFHSLIRPLTASLKQGVMCAVIAGYAGFCLSVPAFASLSSEDKAEVQLIIENYIRENPEIVQQALADLARREAEQRRNFALELVQMDENDPFIGNPDGDITIYEFSDYNCGYCKRLFATLQEIIDEDDGVRLVLKEFPILAQSSAYAAQTAVALHRQNKFEPFHIALMSTRGRLDETLIDRIARQTGADMSQLAADRDSAAVIATLEAVQTAAQALEIRGTPALLIGDTLIPGAISKAEIITLINQARNAKTK